MPHRGAPRPPVVVPEHDSPRTIKAWLHDLLDVPHRTLEKWIHGGLVLCDGKPCLDPAFRPPALSRLEVVDRPPGGPVRRPPIQGPGFRSALEDHDLIAVSKEPGVVVIPTGKPSRQPGLGDAGDLPLVARVAAALRLAGRRADPLWVVHRIDRDTSGLVLFARNRAAYEHLRNAFRRRAPERVYLAWCLAHPDPPAGTLDHRLTEDPRSHRVRVASGSAREASRAVLDYRTLATGSTPGGEPLARVEIHLVTGRRNQIRAQFAHQRWPLAGDRWYDAERPGLIERAALHAWRLRFGHPSERGQVVQVEAPLPEDLRAIDRHVRPRMKAPADS